MTGFFIDISEYCPDPIEEEVKAAIEHIVLDDYIIVPSATSNQEPLLVRYPL